MRAGASLLAVLSAGCLSAPADSPAPPAASRAEGLEREAPAALDGRASFAIASRPGQRFVSVEETERGGLAVRDDGALVALASPSSPPLARDVLPELSRSADGRVVAYAVRTADALADVHVLVDGRERRLTRDLGAVVLAVSPAGDEVAVLHARGGLPGISIVSVEGGALRPLTNARLVREPGRRGPPEGFVPPPVRAAGVSWVGDVIEYEAAGGVVRLDAAGGRVLEAP